VVSRGSEDCFDQVRGGRFAVRSGDADQGHRIPRPAVPRCDQVAEGAEARWHHDDRRQFSCAGLLHLAPHLLGLQRAFNDYGSGTALDRCANKRVAIAPHSGHRNKHISRFDAARVVAYGCDPDLAVAYDAANGQAIDEFE
jgi:hypothetical protein